MAPPILLGRLASVQHKWINNNGNSWLLFIFVFVLVLVVIVLFLSDLVDSIIVIVNNNVIGNHEFRPSDTTDTTDRVSRKSKEDIGRRCRLLFVYSKMVFLDDLRNVCESSSYRWTSTVRQWSLTIYANVFTGEKEFLEDESQEFRDRRSTVHRVSPRIATMEEIERSLVQTKEDASVQTWNATLPKRAIQREMESCFDS